MRVDKYLKVSRIIKRRTVANDACDSSYIKVNGRVVKASYDVKLGDVIEVSFGSRVTAFKVISVDEPRKKDFASAMYEVIS